MTHAGSDIPDRGPWGLVIGYGNPGRRDDGLGPALAAAVEAWHLPGVSVQADYQLTVEDAADVARHAAVLFADADVQCPEPFSFARVFPQADVSFSSHSVPPAAVLGLAHDLFGARTEGYVLGIRGYDFEPFDPGAPGLTAQARANLEAALAFLEPMLRAGRLHVPQGPLEKPVPATGTC